MYKLLYTLMMGWALLGLNSPSGFDNANLDLDDSKSNISDLWMISRPDDGQIFLTLGGNDGMVGQVIRIQTKNHSEYINQRFTNANVYFSAKKLRFSATDDRGNLTEYSFEIGEKAPTASKPEQKVFGIARREGNWMSNELRNMFFSTETDMNEVLVMSSDLSASEKVEMLALISGCTGGGVGETTCSARGMGWNCSVSCGAGYYACCNVASCECNENSPEI